MSKSLTLPEGVEFTPVKILSNSGESLSGSLAFKKWTDHERRSRAARRTAKIIGTIFACSLIGLFVHILLLIIIPGLFVTILAAFPLFIKLSNEDATFFYVEGSCPYCKKKQTLRPYLDTQFKEQVTVQCPECGQTVQALNSAA